MEKEDPLDGSKITPNVDRAAKATGKVLMNECKAKNNMGKKLAESLGVSYKELGAALMKGDFSYKELLQMCVILKIKATDVFAKTKEEMAKSPKAEGERRSPETHVDAVDDSTSKTTTQTIEPEKPALPQDLEPVNDDNPEDPPFIITAEQAGVKGASALMLEWNEVKTRMRPLFDSDTAYEDYLTRMPKPHKDTSTAVTLDFGSASRRQEFFNLGAAQVISDYISEKGYDAVVGYKPAPEKK